MAIAPNPTLLTTVGAKGSPGVRIRYGTAAPTSSTVANDGDPYIDVANYLAYAPRVGGVWPANPKSTVGPRGPTGATPLVTQNVSVGNAVITGPAAGFGTSITLASGFTTLPIPGTDRAATFYSGSATCSLQGACLVNQAVSAASVTFQLVRADNQAVVYQTGSIAPGNVVTVGPFAQATYPMASGVGFVWQISPSTGAKAVSAAVYPFYFGPGDAGANPSFYPRAGLTSGTFSASSGQVLFLPGDDTQAHYYRNGRASALYGAILNNQTSVALTFSFGSYTSGSIAANTSVGVGPFSPINSTYRLSAATNYQWSIGGFSGTISNALVTADAIVVV